MTVIDEHRRFLVGLAYRMLGSLAEAEDIVQDAYLRTRDVAMDEPRAYLARVVTNLCLDRLKSARVRREEYVGTWLPEPVVEDPAAPLAEDLSVALLMVLESLSPLERAAFLLHDIFDMDYADVAKTLERSEAACRQLASRAREHVREARPQVAPADASVREVEADGLIRRSGDWIEVTDEGRPLVRAVAAAFDSYLPSSTATHVAAV